MPLFEEIGTRCDLHVILSRLTHPRRRSWTPPQEPPTHYKQSLLRTVGVDWSLGALDLSIGTARELDRTDPDVVVVAGWNLPSSWVALRWGVARGRPVVLWSESNASSGNLRGGLSNRLRSEFVRRVRVALVPGEAGEAYIRTLLPPGHRILFMRMPNPVVASELRRLSPIQHQEDGPGRRLAFIGELSQRKGFDLVLDAARILPAAATLNIVGAGPLAAEAAEAAASHPDINFHGYRDGAELGTIWSATDTVILPSRRDPWPLVAAEALTAGRRLVLGPNVGSVPDLVRYPQVAVMSEYSGSAVIRGVLEVAEADIQPEARDAFLPSRCGESFVEACRLAREAR